MRGANSTKRTSSNRRKRALGKAPFRTGQLKVDAEGKEQHKNALLRWARVWRTPDLPHCVKILFSTRLRKSLGRVRAKSGVITLNTQLASVPRSVLLEVLCHEAAHVAIYLLHGWRAKPHGPEWRELVQLAGYRPATRLRCPQLHSAEMERLPAPRTHCRCPVCLTEYFVHRLSLLQHCSVCFRVGRKVKLQRLQTA